MTLWIALGLLAGLLAVQTIRAFHYRRMWLRARARVETLLLIRIENQARADDYWPVEIE